MSPAEIAQTTTPRLGNTRTSPVKRSCSNAPDPPPVSGATSARQMVYAVYFGWRACVSRTIGAIDYVARRIWRHDQCGRGQCGLAGTIQKARKTR